ncbi:MAG: phage tail protein [Saprospiraceae bacterium]|nr:phage tail protein [Saprospiraceae bacterium]
MEGYLSQIMMWAGNYAPKGWAFCDGQVLSIAQNTALFSLIGTTYGGNGRDNFALPDLRGRVPLHVSTNAGNGLLTHVLGEKGGSETVTLNVAQLPAHNHPVMGTLLSQPLGGSINVVSADTGTSVRSYMSERPVNLNITSASTGSNQPIPNMQPYLSINFIICINGMFPSRD